MSQVAREIFYCPYTLKSRFTLNAKSRDSQREGALLRVDGGYADCFPWPELGDEPLAKQLEMLKSGELSDLTRRSLHFAEIDSKASVQEVNPWENLCLPPSHFLVTDFKIYEPTKEFSSLLNSLSAYPSVKIKMGSVHLSFAVTFLERLTSALEGSNIKIRLDFNESLNPDSADSFFSQLSESFFQRLDFVEDPCPWSPKVWETLNEKFKIRLGVDRALKSAVESEHDGGESQAFQLLVVKPAKVDSMQMAEWAAAHMKRLVVTSYMDHPVGQMCAAFTAAKILALHPLLLDTCGLLSENLFEESDFSRTMNNMIAQRVLPIKSGWGFEDLLSSLEWRKLR